MNFVILDAETFRKFAEKSPYKSFTQTPEIAKLREENGWVAYYFGVEAERPSSEDRKLGRAPLSVSEEDGSSASTHNLIAAAMLIAKPTFLGKSTFYCPGGPLMDYEDTALVNFFMRHLKKYAKTHNGYTIHIDPYYELIERTRDGEIKEGGFNHKKGIKNLKKLGFRSIKSTMPRYLFVLDLKNRTEDQLLADMKRNTRNHVRKAEKMGVTVRELKREELSIFKQITESTSNRRHFQDRPLSYYQDMYDLFHKRGEVKFLLAEANGIPLSAAMFMLYGDEVIYLYSGSDEQYMKDYNAQYVIQWYMIKYAAKHKFKTYNFYGIQGLPDKTSKDYGIYDFKKGFTSEETGRVVELIGSYELPVNQPFYQLHHFLSNLKHR